MQKIIGLCFLTATLLASSAHAQSIFIEKGDPNTMNAMVGAGVLKDAWGASLIGGFSYRGVFDVGLDFTRYAYTGGNAKNLAGYGAMPFVSAHLLRADESMPISIAVLLGVQRIFYTGNGPSSGPVANPEGWGVVAGPSVYRRFEFGTNFVFVPELLVAYDYQSTRYYSTALDQSSGNATATIFNGYSNPTTSTVRALLRPNLLYKRITVVPYVGYQGALAAGIDVGSIF
jgi:hypothetical protein